MMTRRLPIVAESAIGNVKAIQARRGRDFEDSIKGSSPVTCKKGCSNCCNHPVYISIAEGIWLYRSLYESRQWLVIKRKLEEAKEMTMGLSPEVWMMVNTPCPLLDNDKECRAYSARPLRCRTMFSIGSPEMCHPHAAGSGSLLSNNLIEILAFNHETRDAMKNTGSRGLLVPLSVAVLLGETVDTGKMTIEQAEQDYVREYRGRS